MRAYVRGSGPGPPAQRRRHVAAHSKSAVRAGLSGRQRRTAPCARFGAPAARPAGKGPTPLPASTRARTLTSLQRHVATINDRLAVFEVGPWPPLLWALTALQPRARTSTLAGACATQGRPLNCAPTLTPRSGAWPLWATASWACGSSSTACFGSCSSAAACSCRPCFHSCACPLRASPHTSTPCCTRVRFLPFQSALLLLTPPLHQASCTPSLAPGSSSSLPACCGAPRLGTGSLAPPWAHCEGPPLAGGC